MIPLFREIKYFNPYFSDGGIRSLFLYSSNFASSDMSLLFKSIISSNI